MFSYFILHFFFLTTLIKDALNSNGNTLLERIVSADRTLRNEGNSSKNSKHPLLENIMEGEDMLELMLSPEFAPFISEELNEKQIIRKSRKQVNATTKDRLQYVKKKYIYRGDFLTFFTIVFGMYLILIFSVQVWILISRIEIKNGTWSIGSAEKTTWWFDQVENLRDQLVKFSTNFESKILLKFMTDITNTIK